MNETMVERGLILSDGINALTGGPAVPQRPKTVDGLIYEFRVEDENPTALQIKT